LYAFLVLASTAACGEDWWEDDNDDYPPIVLELNAWVNRIAGDIRWGSSDVPGSVIDFRRDAGLDSNSVAPYVQLIIGLSERWDLRFSFWHSKHKSTTQFTEPESFSGVTFPPGEDFKTQFTFSAYSALAGFRVLHGEQLDLALLGGVGFFRPKLEIENVDATLLAENEALIVSPQIGFAIDLWLNDALVLRGQVTGFGWDSNAVNGRQYDAEGSLQWNIAEGIYVQGGYKFFKADADFGRGNSGTTTNERNSASFSIEGPYAGLGLVF